MKKVMLLILSVFLSGCSGNARGNYSNASGIFEEVVGNTYLDERMASDSRTELTGITAEYSVMTLYRVEEDALYSTIFYGYFLDDKLNTFEYYTDDSHGLRNYINEKMEFNEFSKIGETRYIVKNEDINKDGSVNDYTPIYWFDSTSGDITFNYTMIHLPSDTSKKTMSYDELEEYLSDEHNIYYLNGWTYFFKNTIYSKNTNYLALIYLMNTAEVHPNK